MTTAHNTGSVEAETMGQPPAWTPHSKQHMLESFKQQLVGPKTLKNAASKLSNSSHQDLCR